MTFEHNPGFKELEEIIQIHDTSIRVKLFNLWIKNFLDFSEFSQLALNSYSLTSMEKDFAFEYVTKMCANSLIDKNLADLSIDKNRFNCYILALRTKAKDNNYEDLKKNQTNVKKIRKYKDSP